MGRNIRGGANYDKNFADIVFEKNILSWTDPKANFCTAQAGITTDVFTCGDNVYSFPENPCQQTCDAYTAWTKRGLDSASVVADAMFVHPAAGLLWRFRPPPLDGKATDRKIIFVSV